MPLCLYVSVCPSIYLCYAYWYTDTRIHAYMVYMAVWLHGYYIATWLCGYMSIWLYGYTDVWLHVYMAVWLHGCMATWLYVYMSMWLYSPGRPVAP